MLIYQKFSGSWNKDKRNYEFSKQQPKLLYRGRFATAMGGGGGSQSEVVATGPWQQQVPYINMLMDQAMRLYQGGPPQYYPGQLTPNVNPTLQGSWDAANAAVNANAQTNDAIQRGLVTTANAAGSNPVNQVAGQVAPNVATGVNQLIGGQNAALTSGQASAQPMTGAINTSLYGTNATQRAGGAVTPGVVGAVNNLATGQNAALRAGAQLYPGVAQTIASAGAPAPTTQFGTVDANQALNTALNSNGLNPYTGQIVDAALRSSNDQFQTNVLPSIRSAAGQANQPGGTRQGIAEGIAARGLIQQQGDIVSRLYGQAFDTGSADRNAALNLVAQGQLGNTDAALRARQLGLVGAGIGSDLLQSGSQLGVQGQIGAGQIGGNLLTSGSGQQLQAAGQAGNLLTQGSDLSQQATSTGTAQGSNLINSGNSAAMQQYFQSLGLIPQIQANQVAQYGFQNQSGLQQYGIGQAGIDANVDRYFYNTLAPYNALTQFQNYISGAYGSSLPGQIPQNSLPYGYQFGSPAPTPGTLPRPVMGGYVPMPSFNNSIGWEQLLRGGGGLRPPPTQQY